MNNRHHLIQQHHQMAHAHHTHAHNLYQQMQMHQRQAQFHQQQAMNQAHQASATLFGEKYDPRMTAYYNQVSPAALIYQGRLSPESVASLQEYHNQFSGRNPYGAPDLSSHMAHANENHAAMQRGHRF